MIDVQNTISAPKQAPPVRLSYKYAPSFICHRCQNQIQNSNDEFIRLNDGVYELTSADNGVSVYSKVDGETDPHYYIFGASSSTVEEINTDSFKQQSSAKVFEKVYSISQANLKDSQDEISCSI